MFLGVLFWLIVLFLAGVAFAYFVVLKFSLKVLLFDFSGDFDPFITVANYLGFVWKFLIPFGIVFEIPLLVYFLTRFGLVTPDTMTKYRRWVILLIVTAAGVFSPPDVVSQALLALPMYVLFEISIVISRSVYRARMKKLAQEEGKCILFSTHDLDIALSLCDSIMLIDNPYMYTLPTSEMITSGHIERLFRNESVTFDAQEMRVRIKSV